MTGGLGSVREGAADPFFGLLVLLVAAAMAGFGLYRYVARTESPGYDQYSYWRGLRSTTVRSLGLVFITGYALWSSDLGIGFVSPQGIDPTVIGLGVLGGIVLSVASVGLTPLLEIIGLSYVPWFESALELIFPQERTEWVAFLTVGLPAIALGEELFYRGGVILGLAVAFNVPLVSAVFVSAVIFGLTHAWQGTVGIVSASMLGVGFGALYVATGSLWTAVLAHYIVNLFAAILNTPRVADQVPGVDPIGTHE